MNRPTKIILAAALIACFPLATVHADIYRYTDQNGVLHFTNVNGGGKNHKRIRSEAGEARSDGRTPRARSSSPAPISSSNFPSAYAEMISSSCDRHGVDPSLVHAIVKVESDFNPYAMSTKGAMGLMQLMPETAVNLNVKNTFNPAENIDGGVKYLRYLIDRYEGNLSLALAAYNSGETAVKRWGTIPPFRETQNYVQRILKIYNGGGKDFVTHYTIYMGYSDDGALILTDNPSNHPAKKLKARKKNL
jgi:hypothetical protein